MRIILDVQHAGKPSNPGDRGTGADQDRDGKIEIHEQEAELTPIIVHGASIAAADYEGVHVHVLTRGEYADRQRQANEICKKTQEPTAYFALHLNSASTLPSPPYALVGFDARSKGSEALARCLADAWGKAGYVAPVRIEGTTPTSAQSWQRNVNYTIAGVYAGPSLISGVCCELAFIQDTKGAGTAGLLAQGAAIVNAAMCWLGTYHKGGA